MQTQLLEKTQHVTSSELNGSKKKKKKIKLSHIQDNETENNATKRHILLTNHQTFLRFQKAFSVSLNSFALHQVAVEAGGQSNDRLIPVASTGSFVPFSTGNTAPRGRLRFQLRKTRLEFYFLFFPKLIARHFHTVGQIKV